MPTKNTILTYFHNFTKKQPKITRKDFFFSKKAKEILGKLLKADKKVPQALESSSLFLSKSCVRLNFGKKLWEVSVKWQGKEKTPTQEFPTKDIKLMDSSLPVYLRIKFVCEDFDLRLLIFDSEFGIF